METLARHQRELGLAPSVLVATFDPTRVGTEHVQDLSVTRLLAIPPLEEARSSEAVEIGRIRAELEALNPDVVHVHHWHGIGPFVARAAREAGLRIVVSLHDLFTVCPLFFRLREDRELCSPGVERGTCATCLGRLSGLDPGELERDLTERERRFRAELEAADLLFALSDAHAAYLRSVPALAGLDIEMLGFPTQERIGRAREPRPPGQPLQIATWGGLVRGKGLRVLVEAARRLPPGSVELHHHGSDLDEEFGAEVLELAGDLPLTLHGAFEPGELSERLAGIDLAVHPSLYLETYGYTTDEALHLGLPVVVPDRGAPAERVGTRGIVFRVGDVEDLARVLGELVESPRRLEQLAAGHHAPLTSAADHARAIVRRYES